MSRLGIGQPLGDQAREIVYNVYLYLFNAKIANHLRYNVANSTSDATGVSVRFVYKIVKERRAANQKRNQMGNKAVFLNADLLKCKQTLEVSEVVHPPVEIFIKIEPELDNLEDVHNSEMKSIKCEPEHDEVSEDVRNSDINFIKRDPEYYVPDIPNSDLKCETIEGNPLKVEEVTEDGSRSDQNGETIEVDPLIVIDNSYKEVSDDDSMSDPECETIKGADNFVEEVSENDSMSGKIKEKKFFCMYCMKFKTRLTHHLISMHHEEFKVKQIMSFKPMDSKRKTLLRHIRNKGMRIYNKSVGSKEENMIVSNKPSTKRSIINFNTCEECGVMVSDLSRHMNSCQGEVTLLTGSTPISKYDQMLIVNSLLEKSKVNNNLKVLILIGMRYSYFFSEILNEALIEDYGVSLIKTYLGEVSEKNLIRNKLREVAQLSLVMKENAKITELKYFFTPNMFSHLILAVKTIAGWKDGAFRTPSLVPSLGKGITELANILEIKYLKSGNKEGLVHLEEWRRIFEIRFLEDAYGGC